MSKRRASTTFLYQVLLVNRGSRDATSAIQPIEIDTERVRLDQELEIARCSPDTELGLLQERITKRYPPARPAYRTLDSPDFDAGFAGETLHFGADKPATRLAPAINILMVCELTGVPPRVDNFVFFNEATTYAMQWVRDEFPGLWAAFALRYGGIGIAKDPVSSDNNKQDAIRRTTLENLPLQHVERLFTAAMRELERILDSTEAEGTSDPSRFSMREFWFTARLVDVVTRFSMCLDEEKREWVLTLALRLSQVPVFRRHPSGQDIIGRLVRRVVPYLNLEQLNKWFVDLLVRFPLAQADHDAYGRWPEIMAYVHIPRASSINRSDLEDFNAAVEKLIDLVSSTDIQTRTDAALRLLKVFKWNLLSDVERQSFERALWDMTDSQGLPTIADAYVPKFVHLAWPTDVSERAIKGLAKWIMSEKIKDRFILTDGESEDGKPRYSVSWPDQDKYLQSLMGLAEHLRR